jgi:predicted Zn-dependent peptidase
VVGSEAMNYQATILNGIPLAVAQMPQVQSVCVGLWFQAGSRYETRAENGASHFVEHLLFKGTKRRSARQISEAVEGVGGYLNAFTGEEVTCYYAAATVSQLPLLIEVLYDMVTSSTFLAQEVNRERGVITEEIKMYEDQPAQVANEALNALLWPGHALGRPITGTMETVQRISRSTLLAHWRRYYSPAQMQVIVAGNITSEAVTQMLKGVFPRKATSKAPPAVAKIRLRTGLPTLSLTVKPIEQTHFTLGLRAISRHDPRRYALKLASVMLGENMSSILFQEIRENRGLAYSIGSQVSYFQDAGALSVSAGVENEKALEAFQLTLKLMHQLGRRARTGPELKRAKDYVIGQMWLGLESTSNQMMWLGESLLGYGRISAPEEIVQKIQAVRGEEVRQIMAELCVDHRLCVAVVSPEDRKVAFKRAAHF